MLCDDISKLSVAVNIFLYQKTTTFVCVWDHKKQSTFMCVSVLQEEMARAQVLILHGHQLAANHHYALALIVQRCNELRHYCDVITNAIRTKRASLTRARDLLLRLEAVKILTHDMDIVVIVAAQQLV